MFYRETGQIKTDYKSDMAMFPITQDRWFIYGCIAIAVVGLPLIASSYIIEAFLIPILIWSLAALSLNMLLGYCGQLSLGHGGFMAVGAYAAYNFATRIPELNIFIVFILAGLCAAAVSVLFGLPSMRIKGFYLAVATLAAQFFLVWLFNRHPTLGDVCNRHLARQNNPWLPPFGRRGRKQQLRFIFHM